MIGLVGHINNKKDYTRNMLKTLNHRGSIESYFSDEDVNIGLISNYNNIYSNNNVYLILDGRIINNTSDNDYNYLYNLYKEYNEEIFNIIEGNYSLFIYDKNINKIILGKDMFGSKPLYYTKEPFIFATEAKAILENKDYHKEFNSDGLKDFLLYLSNPNDETLFKGIFKVPAGSYLIYQNKRITLKKYYHFDFGNYKNEDTLTNELCEAINKNVQLPSGCASFLSSGIDSSTIVSINKPKDTYTIGYEENKYNESNTTKLLCDILKINNNIKIVNKDEYLSTLKDVQYAMDEPSFDPAVVSLYIGAKEASKKYKFISSGESIDELFAGYYPYLDPIKYKKCEKLPKFINKLISNIAIKLPEFKGINFILRRTLPYEESYTSVSRIYNINTLNKLLNNKSKSNYISINKRYIKERYNNIEKMQIIDINTWMIEELHATERMCACNGIEAITPFLCSDIINIASNTKIDYKLKDNQTKVIMRKVVKKIIPEEAYCSKKLGFPVPINLWVKTNEYYNEIYKAFNSKTANKFFNTKMLNKWLNLNNKNKKDYTKQIWSIYSFIVWYDLYFK